MSGIDISLYATLCALMKDTGGDERLEIAIAHQHGVSAEAWRESKRVWTARMAHGAPNQVAVVQAFIPVYQATLAELRGAVEPMSLERFARITQEIGLQCTTDGERIRAHTVIGRYGLSINDWAEANSYWTPRVNDPGDIALRQRWAGLLQDEADRIMGIERPPADPPITGSGQDPTNAAPSGGFWRTIKRLLPISVILSGP